MACYPHRYFCRKLPEPVFFFFPLSGRAQFHSTPAFPSGLSPKLFPPPAIFSFSNILSPAAEPSAAPSPTCILICQVLGFFFSPLWKAASQQLLTLNLHHDENKPANSTLQGRELRKRRQKPGLVSAPPRKSAALWSQEGAETLEGPIQWHHWAPSTY